MTDADQKRLEEMRKQHAGCGELGPCDIPWLLDKLDEKERELIAARGALEKIAYYNSTEGGIACDALGRCRRCHGAEPEQAKCELCNGRGGT